LIAPNRPRLYGEQYAISASQKGGDTGTHTVVTISAAYDPEALDIFAVVAYFFSHTIIKE